MTFAQTMRLIWIDAMLSSGYALNRSDICAAFGVSTPQASLDLTAYRTLHGDKIAYDTSRKNYIRIGTQHGWPADIRMATQAAVSSINDARSATHAPRNLDVRMSGNCGGYDG